MANKRKTLLHINPKNISVAEDFNSRCDFGDIEELAALKEQLNQKAIDSLNKKEEAKAADAEAKSDEE